MSKFSVNSSTLEMYSSLFTFVCVVFALEYSVYSKPITVGTYNAYLAVAVFPGFEERKNAIIDKVAMRLIQSVTINCSGVPLYAFFVYS